MNMDQEKFDAMIKRLEELAKRRPNAYKLRVFLLALLGYGYIFSIAAILLALLAFLVWGTLLSEFHINFGVLKIAGALLILTGIILRALWVRVSPPIGLRLDRTEAEQLYEEVDHLRKALKAPDIHEILLSDEFNALIAQIPRLGVLGWYKNYLMIGLPLLHALSPHQLRAVLAHELGHLSGAHGKFSGWIYRTRATWFQLLAELEERGHWGAIIFVKFFEWYAPYFAAYSFVLARSQEYEADRLAAEIAGSENVADMLIRLVIGTAFLEEEFWPSIFKLADSQPQPPSSPYAQMPQALDAGLLLDQAQKWLTHAMLLGTDAADTHPSLADRLHALGLRERLPVPFQQSAAEYFLGKSFDALSGKLNREWETAVTSAWKQRYEYAQESQLKLSELRRKAQSEPLTVEEAWQQAYWTEEFEDSRAALPLYQGVLDLQPEHTAALFSVGRILLWQDQAEGIGHIEKAMQMDGEYALPGCQVVCSYLVEKGRQEEAKAFYEQALNQALEFSES